MIHKQKFIKALGTLFYSWGSEAPAEVIWGANDLLEWFESEYSVSLGQRFEEDIANNMNYDAVINAINKS